MSISGLATVDADVAEPVARDATDLAVKLFGDPLRRRIVELLADEQLCTCHLVEETGARQSTVSHHLKVLRDAGLVGAEGRGRFTYYRLLPEALSDLIVDLAKLSGRAQRAHTRRPCP